MPLPDLEKVSGLGLAEPLPLSKLIMFDTVLNAAQANAAGAVYQLAQFTMPFLGDVVLNGTFKLQTNSPGVQAVDGVQISTTSTPAPYTNPYSTWRTAGGASFAVTHVPILAYWSAVTRNTVVTVQGYVGNGSGGIAITVIRATGMIMCCKTGTTGIIFP